MIVTSPPPLAGAGEIFIAGRKRGIVCRFPNVESALDSSALALLVKRAKMSLKILACTKDGIKAAAIKSNEISGTPAATAFL